MYLKHGFILRNIAKILIKVSENLSNQLKYFKEPNLTSRL